MPWNQLCFLQVPPSHNAGYDQNCVSSVVFIDAEVKRIAFIFPLYQYWNNTSGAGGFCIVFRVPDVNYFFRLHASPIKSRVKYPRIRFLDTHLSGNNNRIKKMRQTESIFPYTKSVPYKSKKIPLMVILGPGSQ